MPERHRPLSLSVLMLMTLAGCAAAPAPEPDPEHREQIEQYRTSREERLRKADGWLTLVGLFWLEPGDNPMGSDASNKVVLPAGAAPPRAGNLVYDGREVRLIAEPGVEILVEDVSVTDRILLADADGGPDVVRLGRLRLYVIRREERVGIRVKDPESPVRLEFHGLDYFPVGSAYRVVGEFRPFPEPREIELATAVGTRAHMLVPGEIAFSLGGREHTLLPLVDSPDETEFFLIFRDETSGAETYGAGRYLYADLEDEKVVLDFNKAYNPPCAFTAFATCSLPPPENRIASRIEAGEKAYAGH